MTSVERPKNIDWRVLRSVGGYTTDQIQLAILMDIRDELQRLNNILLCPNLQMIPSMLQRIQANTAKPNKPKRKPKAVAKS